MSRADSTRGPRAPSAHAAAVTPTIRAAIDAACESVAPAWPLDRAVAVNPLWKHIDRPIEQIDLELRALGASQLVIDRAYLRARRAEGALTDRAILSVIAERPGAATLDSVLAWLARDERPALAPMTVAARRDALDRPPVQHSWRELVVDRVSAACAQHFDRDQRSIRSAPSPTLLARWKRSARDDRWLHEAMGDRSLAEGWSALSEEPDAVIAGALATLGLQPVEHESYLRALLFDVLGWASYAAFLQWDARLRGASDDALRSVLAIRAAYDEALLRTGPPALEAQWRAAWKRREERERFAAEHREERWVAQRALERSFQWSLARSLLRPTPTDATAIEAQLVFCIDVRSEGMRRAVERRAPSFATLGFAGFFGLPIAATASDDPQPSAQLPALLAPRYRLVLGQSPRGALSRALRSAVRTLTDAPASGFALVDATGLAQALSYGGARGKPPLDRRSFSLIDLANDKPLTVEQRAALAAGLLRGASLTGPLAPVVALIGHHTRCANNAQRASLECGACGGHSGWLNARIAAALLNDPEVRSALVAQGVSITDETIFVAGVHETTTDAVELDKPEQLTPAQEAIFQRIVDTLSLASRDNRRERAPQLDIAPTDDDVIERALERRASDWSEVRPEWGLVANAAFVVAPRAQTRATDLQRRVFLHEYVEALDPSHAVLEQIMTAPMVVAHWINFQYYASMVDPARFGSGDKTLHNVVGQQLGVLEGAAGDLRIGLSRQSLNDGERWVHEPLRLTVVIDAARDAIDAVIARHPTVRSLVEGDWLHLFQLDRASQALWQRDAGGWRRSELSER